MSKTFRNTPDDAIFRKPKTVRERRQNAGLDADVGLEYDYRISKDNRRHRHIPSDWDDLPLADH